MILRSVYSFGILNSQNKFELKLPKRRYLLSIDGGGIRGIVPLYALIKLEEETGKLSREIFDFVAGTSTGAIIASGIAVGLPATKLLDIYLKRADEIFPQYPWNILKRIFWGYMYSTKKINQVLSQELGEAKDWTINDSPIDLLITAKRVVDSRPFYFVKDNNLNSCACGQLKLTDCVTASAAAPTYFYPWEILESLGSEGKKIKVGALIDGGVGVTGNPVYQACVEAFYYSDKYKPDNTTIISLGTGRFLHKSHPKWLWGWFVWIVDELLNSPSEQQTEIVSRHFPKALFYRLDPDFKQLDPKLTDEIPMDDISSIDKLTYLGQKFAGLIDWRLIFQGKLTKFKVE